MRRAWAGMVGWMTAAMLLGGCAPVGMMMPITPKQTPGKPVKERRLEAATDADKALAAEWRVLAEKWKDAPAAREVILYVRQPWNALSVARLAGEAPGTPQDMGSARALLNRQVRQLQQLKDWPAERAYVIQKAARVIEGDVIENKALWAGAEKIAIDYLVQRGERTPMGNERAACRFLWDEKALHVLFEVVDGEVIAPYKLRDEAVWRGDCVELFVGGNFAPKSGRPAYWELNVSPDGVIYDGLNLKNLDDFGCDVDEKKNATEMRVYTRRSDVGYAVQISLPWGSVPGFEGAAGRGKAVWMLAGWVEKKDGKGAEYYSHTPVLMWFHNVWGYSRFELR